MILKIVIIATCYIFGWLSHYAYMRVRPHGTIEVSKNKLEKLEIYIPLDEIHKKRCMAIRVLTRK